MTRVGNTHFPYTKEGRKKKKKLRAKRNKMRKASPRRGLQ